MTLPSKTIGGLLKNMSKAYSILFFLECNFKSAIPSRTTSRVSGASVLGSTDSGSDIGSDPARNIGIHCTAAHQTTGSRQTVITDLGISIDRKPQRFLNFSNISFILLPNDMMGEVDPLRLVVDDSAVTSVTATVPLLDWSWRSQDPPTSHSAEMLTRVSEAMLQLSETLDAGTFEVAIVGDTANSTLLHDGTSEDSSGV